MPSSSLVAAYPLVKSVLAQKPSSVLDLGMGTGKFGYLLREQTDLAQGRKREDWQLRLVGVEGSPEYVGEHQRLIYDEVVVADIRDYLDTTRESFDVVLLLDVLEHFDPQEGLEVVRAALRAGGVLYVTTPRRYHPQELANPLEHHRSWWPPQSLRDLAARLDAHVTIRQFPIKTLAVFSHEPVRLGPSRRERVRTLRRALLPDRLAYRIRGGVGPTLTH